MRDQWLRECIRLSSQQADFYSGARKILTNVTFSWDALDFTTPVELRDCGFTKSKLTMLRRLYYDEAHTQAVSALWDRRLSQGKYGSVGVSTYHHLVKNDPTKKSKRASVMGPCLLGVTLTLLNGGATVVDAFYRTTELYKKFPADLVFLNQVLLAPFKIDELKRVNFHFANVTCHPMYFVTLIPNMGKWFDVQQHLEKLKMMDPYFYKWVIKWTARYLCEEYSRGILKFSQALRVRKDAMERINPKVLPHLQKYLRAWHPGYRGEYKNDEEPTE